MLLELELPVCNTANPSTIAEKMFAYSGTGGGMMFLLVRNLQIKGVSSKLVSAPPPAHVTANWILCIEWMLLHLIQIGCILLVLPSLSAKVSIHAITGCFDDVNPLLFFLIIVEIATFEE